MLFAGFMQPRTGQQSWLPLFNGKDLSGWDVYIGPLFDASGKQQEGTPAGLNNDPKKVFSIVNVGGENIIRISGENFGGMSTVGEYENYHLRLQFKWGQLKWNPKKDKKRDSGLLYHAVGPHGADFGYWMRSQEFQIEEETAATTGVWPEGRRT